MRGCSNNVSYNNAYNHPQRMVSICDCQAMKSTAITVDNIFCRITSYNVCYTKLLRVLLFLDTYSEAEALYKNYAPSVEPDMDKLLENWGISIHKGKIIGDSLLARS